MVRGEFYLKSEGSGGVVSPGSIRGYEAGAASSLDVLESFFDLFSTWTGALVCRITGSLAIYPLPVPL